MASPPIIVGAGISGLHIENRLRKKNGIRALVLEASSRAGGRVNSVYHEEMLQYEAGPWRIPLSHQRTLALIRQHNIQTMPLPMQPPPHNASVDIVPGLTKWEVRALQRRNTLSADHADLETGYADISEAASGTFPYSTHDTEFVTLNNGLQSLIDGMAKEAQILFDTRVVDIRRTPHGYCVQCRCRESESKFVNRTYRTSLLVICVPPSAAERWSIVAQWCRAQIYSVSSQPLHHIYARVDEDPSRRSPVHIRATTSLIAQTISSAYPWSRWIQASYSAGRVARFWHRLRMTSRKLMTALVHEELQKIIPVELSSNPVRSYFVEHAYHQWKPSPMFCQHRAVALGLMPNSTHLPNVYWAGEAFSSHQGWIEGALETSELVIDLITKKTSYILRHRPRNNNEVTLEGRILDLKRFEDGHPGGVGPFQNHVGEDITDLFYHMRHSQNAWAVVYSLQIAMQKSD